MLGAHAPGNGSSPRARGPDTTARRMDDPVHSAFSTPLRSDARRPTRRGDRETATTENSKFARVDTDSPVDPSPWFVESESTSPHKCLHKPAENDPGEHDPPIRVRHQSCSTSTRKLRSLV